MLPRRKDDEIYKSTEVIKCRVFIAEKWFQEIIGSGFVRRHYKCFSEFPNSLIKEKIFLKRNGNANFGLFWLGKDGNAFITFSFMLSSCFQQLYAGFAYNETDQDQ